MFYAGNREMDSPLNSEIESFFDSAPPLNDRAAISEKLKEFIALNSSESGKGSRSPLLIIAKYTISYIHVYIHTHTQRDVKIDTISRCCLVNSQFYHNSLSLQIYMKK